MEFVKLGIFLEQVRINSFLENNLILFQLPHTLFENLVHTEKILVRL